MPLRKLTPEQEQIVEKIIFTRFFQTVSFFRTTNDEKEIAAENVKKFSSLVVQDINHVIQDLIDTQKITEKLYGKSKKGIGDGGSSKDTSVSVIGTDTSTAGTNTDTGAVPSSTTDGRTEDDK